MKISYCLDFVDDMGGISRGSIFNLYLGKKRKNQDGRLPNSEIMYKNVMPILVSPIDLQNSYFEINFQ